MDAAPAGGEEAATSRRRSRWGEAEAAGEADPSKKKSRWGNKEETPLMSLGSASLIVQQNPELIKIQVRLTEIQRLQALPRCLHCRIGSALSCRFQRTGRISSPWFRVSQDPVFHTHLPDACALNSVR